MEATNQQEQGQGYRSEAAEAAGLTISRPAPSADRRSGAGSNQSSTPTPKIAADPCGICGAAQSAIRINVDGNTLLMESCDTCDVRRWQLEGERIDLQEALNQVGEHSGRRRSKA